VLHRVRCSGSLCDELRCSNLAWQSGKRIARAHVSTTQRPAARPARSPKKPPRSELGARIETFATTEIT
jgi:hypothetical protein